MAINMHVSTRISVEEYQAMIADGRLTEEDRVELLDGQITEKMPQNTPHSTTLRRLNHAIQQLIQSPWIVQTQMPITLAASEPEPDLTIMEGPLNRYDYRQPTIADIVLVVEVADSSLNRDQGIKQFIYAQAELPVYWIVNVNDACVEVYTQPTGTPLPHYEAIERFQIDDLLPVILAGVEIGQIRVRDLLPE